MHKARRQGRDCIGEGYGADLDRWNAHSRSRFQVRQGDLVNRTPNRLKGLRNIVLSAALLAVGAVASGPALADGSPLSTGNSIYPLCTSTQVQTSIICNAYVVGFVSGISNQAILSESRPVFCLPAESNNGQIIAVFVKYMADHPEKRHIDTPSLIIVSLKEAFPCTERPPLSSFYKK